MSNPTSQSIADADVKLCPLSRVSCHTRIQFQLTQVNKQHSPAPAQPALSGDKILFRVLQIPVIADSNIFDSVSRDRIFDPDHGCQYLPVLKKDTL